MRAALILLALAISALWIWRADWFAIDSCLDSGGRWNDQARTCDR
ncbi:hypothetical protein OVY48_22330 [Sphingobium sp. SA2]|nr:hypothetical protein [Sphingobium sp. SA2]MDT7536137.1 hypothetical protein [Sphingobium sp. SA2]